jgi:transcriptional regulator with XRE-family HTH domain
LLVGSAYLSDAEAVEPTARFEVAFGRVIRRLRQEAGRSQEDVAAAVGISTYYVRELELGRRNRSLSVVVRLAAALGQQPHALMQKAEAAWSP